MVVPARLAIKIRVVELPVDCVLFIRQTYNIPLNFLRDARRRHRTRKNPKLVRVGAEPGYDVSPN